MNCRTAAVLSSVLFLTPVPAAGEDTVSVTVAGMKEGEEAVLCITDEESGETQTEVYTSAGLLLSAGHRRTVTVQEVPPGYYYPAGVSVLDEDVQIRLCPFCVQVQCLDENGETVPDVCFTLTDEEGNRAAEGVPGEAPITGLRADTAYLLCAESVPEGYLMPEPVQIVIPAHGGISDAILKYWITVWHRPHTEEEITETVQTEEEQTEPAVQPSVIIPQAQPVIAVSEEAVTEEAEEEKLPETPAVIPAVIMPEKEPAVSEPEIQAEPGRAAFYVTVTDENGRKLAGAEVAVLDEHGRIVDEWTTETAAHLVENDAVTAGNSYVIRQIRASSGYEVSKTDLEYAIPQEGLQEIPELMIRDRKTGKMTEETAEEHASRHSALPMVIAGIMISAAAASGVFLMRRSSA